MSSLAHAGDPVITDFADVTLWVQTAESCVYWMPAAGMTAEDVAGLIHPSGARAPRTLLAILPTILLPARHRVGENVLETMIHTIRKH